MDEKEQERLVCEALTGCHADGRDYHENLDAAAEDGQKPEHDASAGQDGEEEGKISNADADRVLTVNAEGLAGPEHEDGEEVGAGHECDDEGQGEDSRVLLEPGGEHGKFGKSAFPDAEGNQEDDTQD